MSESVKPYAPRSLGWWWPLLINPCLAGCPSACLLRFARSNTIKALNWYGSVREKLDDPQYEGWFVVSVHVAANSELLAESI